MAKPKSIIGLSFGKSEKTNQYLADIVKQIYHDQSIMGNVIENVFNQTEIANLYDGEGEQYVIYKAEEGKKYLDTIEIFRQVRDILRIDYSKNAEVKWEDLSSIIIVAHPLHLARCVKIAKLFGLNPLEGRVSLNILYDRKDPQWWCRNKFFYMIWECLAYLKLYLFVEKSLKRDLILKYGGKDKINL